MLTPNHPDDERLSALASRDTDATADTSLTGHVSTCDRCTDLVNELGALRVSLAELPDLEPSRPLRLLPEVTEEPAGVDRLGGWARRFFAPVLTAGAAMAMVGLVGTAAPGLGGLASGPASGGNDSVTFELQQPVPSPAEAPAAEGGAAAEPEASAALEGTQRTLGDGADAFAAPSAAAEESADMSVDTFGDSDQSDEALTQMPIERSPWPMVLFSGVALMVAAALLRWILVPRAG